ncbi:MAG: hypothetical protein QOE07_1662 [Acidimicrobiaceae bacterium]|nr:hypothetical protein [Acidimicrobiaceae bacterium]
MEICGRIGKRCGLQLFAVLLLLPVLTACGSAKKAVTGPSAGQVGTTTSATPSPSTTQPAAPSEVIPGGCPSGIGAAAQQPDQAAQCLYRAWEAGDRAQAAVFASLDVVANLFATPWTAPLGSFLGCAAQSDGGQQCHFEHHGGRYEFETRRSEGGWRVTEVQRPSGA